MDLQLTHPEKKKSYTRSARRPYLCYLTAAVVVLVISLVVVLGVLWVKVNRLEANGDNLFLCVSCDELTVTPFREEWPKEMELFPKQLSADGSQEKCCATTSLQVAVMIELLVDRKVKEGCVKENLRIENFTLPNGGKRKGNGSVVGVHLNVGRQVTRRDNAESGTHTRTISSKFPPVRQWSHRDSTAYIEGVRLQNDRIVVKESGLYFIYSQIQFTAGYMGQRVDSPALEHQVCRYSVIYPNGGEQILLTSIKTENGGIKGRYSDTSSYLGAAFVLHKDDQLYVRSSARSKISLNPKSSYFGIFKL